MTPPYRPSDPMPSQHIAPQQPLQWPVKRWESPRGRWRFTASMELHWQTATGTSTCLELTWEIQMVMMLEKSSYVIICHHHTGPIFGMLRMASFCGSAAGFMIALLPFLLNQPQTRCEQLIIVTGWWFEPLWKIWKSVGMMTFPIYGKINHVPNHQPVLTWFPMKWKRFFFGKTLPDMSPPFPSEPARRQGT